MAEQGWIVHGEGWYHHEPPNMVTEDLDRYRARAELYLPGEASTQGAEMLSMFQVAKEQAQWHWSDSIRRVVKALLTSYTEVSGT